MKKFALVLAMIMCLCFIGGCSDSSSSSKSKKKNSSSSSSDNDFVRGKVNGKTYKNSFAKAKIEVPDGWTFSTDEELLKLTNISLDLQDSDDKELMEEILKKTSVYDACMYGPGNDNIIVMFENLKLEGVDVDDFSEKDYLKQVSSLLESETSMDYNIESVGDKVKLGGNTYTTLSVSVKYLGIKMTQTYYARKVGDFMFGITITDASGNPASYYEEFFKDYE